MIEFSDPLPRPRQAAAVPSGKDLSPRIVPRHRDIGGGPAVLYLAYLGQVLPAPPMRFGSERVRRYLRVRCRFSDGTGGIERPTPPYLIVCPRICGLGTRRDYTSGLFYGGPASPRSAATGCAILRSRARLACPSTPPTAPSLETLRRSRLWCQLAQSPHASPSGRVPARRCSRRFMWLAP